MDFDFYIDPITVYFDGVSDFSDVLSRFCTGIVNIIRERALSIVKPPHNSYDKLEQLVNLLISFIPDEIGFVNTGVYIQGGISSNIEIINDEFLVIPMDLSLQDALHPMP